MSKPISFGLASKSKPSHTPTPTPSSTKPGISKPISFSTNSRKPFGAPVSKPKSSALRDDSDEEDEVPPKHEELTGFSATGAILSKPKEQKVERVIENSGNGDWRKRGKNLLPSEVQAAQNGDGLVTVEKDVVSKSYGLQFAEKRSSPGVEKDSNGDTRMQNGDTGVQQPAKEMTDDERALAALLEDGSDKPKSTATIAVQDNDAWQRNEADDFRADVAARPDSSTLEDYAAMPVEEFGMAMLRGMGKKRRANGEVINLNKNAADEDKKKKERKQEGFLGIGAKPVKGLEGVELGAWGKADMRKNARGEGFFMPVMLEDKQTGERITEEEFERRKKKAVKRDGADAGAEEDWRDRRDRNLDRSGRDKDRVRDGDDYANGSTRKRDRDGKERGASGDDGYSSRGSSRRDRDRDRNDRDYGSSRSRRERSRSRDRKGENEDSYADEDDKDKQRRRDRQRDKYRDEDRYNSSSSRRGEHRHRDRDRDRDSDRDRDHDRDRDDRRPRERR